MRSSKTRNQPQSCITESLILDAGCAIVYLERTNMCLASSSTEALKEIHIRVTLVKLFVDVKCLFVNWGLKRALY